MKSKAAVALSLTGSGHLLVYQLGACRVLQQSSEICIKHVAGSSGGAIVATLMAYSHCLDDYARNFIHSRGQGLSLLRERMKKVSPAVVEAEKKSANKHDCPSLSIFTTACRNGLSQAFSFCPSTSNEEDPTRVMKAVDASCRIPQSFHPLDIISPFPLSYPDSDGVLIDDEYFVDGGIAAPAPLIPAQTPTKAIIDHSEIRRIIVSPIAGKSSENIHRVSPCSSSSFWPPAFNLPHGFSVDASRANLRALRISAGLTTPTELEQWYQLGQNDAKKYLEESMDNKK